MPGLNSDTALLLHFDNTDGATSETDASPEAHTITFFGDAQIDTAQSKFGGSSLLFGDTSTCRLTVSASTGINFLNAITGDKTVDMWIKLNQLNDYQRIFAHTREASGGTYIVIDHNGSGNLFALFKNTGTNLGSISVGKIEDNDWHHVALIRVASEIGMYVDGIQLGYLNIASAITTLNTKDMELGNSTETNLGGNNADFWLEELRIQKSNYFGASPDAGLTDSIIVPTTAYSDKVSKNTQGIIIV